MNNDKNNSLDESVDEIIGFFGQGGTFKDVKGISDDAMESIYSIAYNLYQAGKYDEAQKMFQFLCFYDHLNKKYFMGLGACQQMQEEYESAIEIFSFVSLLDSNDPRALVYLGDCYLAMNNKKSAKTAYELAIDWGKGSKVYKEEISRAKTMLKNFK